MINNTGFLRYGAGVDPFRTSDIRSIHKGYIYVPQGDSWQEKSVREVSEKLVKNLKNPEKAEDVKYYAMLCDAACRDFPNSSKSLLMDRNDRPIEATFITGRASSPYAVVPTALASYEEVIKSVAKSLDEPYSVIDIAG